MNVIAENIRQSLLSFWNEQLVFRIESNAIHIAYPLLLPDGWQVSFSIYHNKSSNVFEVSDNRITFDYLENYFPKQTSINKSIIDEKRKFYDLELLPNGILRKMFYREILPSEIQLFAEGLVALHYLVYRFEKHNLAENIPLKTVKDILFTHQIKYQINTTVAGKNLSKIPVDFLCGVNVFRIINSQDPLATIQIAGFRFNDYKMVMQQAKRVLIYNSDREGWNDDCQNIVSSKDHFDFTAPYYDVADIAAFVEEFCEKEAG